MELEPGTMFGPYCLEEKIGSGGMGEVYRATDTRLNREVAIKIVSDQYLAENFGSGSTGPGLKGGSTGTLSSGSPGTISHRRFLREAQASSALNHPNICTIHDIGEQDGRPYLVMELLRGQTLKDSLRAGPLAVTELVLFSRQIAAALAAAHAAGIVHRDIKPANLFVVGNESKRQIKILDFGLAKQQDATNLSDSGDATAVFGGETIAATSADLGLTSPGSAMGTVAYMSPEQAEGQPLDARTDLFSLGSVMYEMATGKTPFTGNSAAGIFAALLTKEPEPVSEIRAAAGLPALPNGFAAVITKLLKKDKTSRYQRATDVETDLENLGTASAPSAPAAPIPVANIPPASPAPAPAPVHVPSEAEKRNKLLRVFAIVIFFAVVLPFLIKQANRFNLNAKPDAAPAENVTLSAQKDAIILAEFNNQTGDPVFDTTLNQALTAQLEQSPVLSLVSQEHLRKSVTFLGRPADTPITADIARQIGEREGVKAVLVGTIASLGKSYAITLTAQKSVGGDEIATTQSTAPDKEHVLDAVNTAGAAMRAKLGESLASIQKLNNPFGDATTPSIEAYRAYALANQAKLRGQEIPEAETLYKRAVALDPKLAMAWARLSTVYSNAQRFSEAERCLIKAHELEANVSDRERRYIEENYDENVTGDYAKAEQTAQETIALYPDNEYALIHLGNAYMFTGEFDNAPPYFERARALVPDDSVVLSDLLWAYGVNGEMDKLKTTLQAVKTLDYNGTQELAAEVQSQIELGNEAEVQRLTAEVAGRPDEYEFLNQLAIAQAEQGKFHAATETWKKSVESAKEVHASDVEASLLISGPIAGWSVGQCGDIQGAVKQGEALAHSRMLDEAFGIYLVLCGDKSGLPRLAQLSRKYPNDVLQVQVWEPESKAWLLLKENKPQQALVELEKGRRYEMAGAGAWMRGLAYLQLKDAHNAIAAFQDATKYRGAAIWAYYFPLPYAQSLLGLGRAYTMAGDKANAKKAYDRFFAEWKNADPDIPDLIQAKKEYAAL